MFQKGNPGRAKGTKNRKTIAVEETAARLGIDPFEVLCHFAKGDWQALGYVNPDAVAPKIRVQAAREACKYLYSQKRSIEVSNADDKGFRILIEDYKPAKKESK